MQISVAGNIGSGKTTLTSLLAKHYGWEAHYEDTEDNPYLNDFYEDMQRWSFNLQIYFLQNRFNKIMEFRENRKEVIMDRTIYEDAYIFAPNLHSMNLLSKRDFDNYLNLFNLNNSLIKPPDLLIYLRSSVPNLVNNIQKRGREYETSIRLDYLNRLNERYEAWVSGYKEGKMLIIDVDSNNFNDDPVHLGEVISKIDAEIKGLL